jgi:hypothetical protein
LDAHGSLFMNPLPEKFWSAKLSKNCNFGCNQSTVVLDAKWALVSGSSVGSTNPPGCICMFGYWLQSEHSGVHCKWCVNLWISPIQHLSHNLLKTAIILKTGFVCAGCNLTFLLLWSCPWSPWSTTWKASTLVCCISDVLFCDFSIHDIFSTICC